MATESTLFEFYHDQFLPIYADLVAVIGKKPPEVLEQLESAFSHFAVARRTSDPGMAKENIEKAHAHIVRATLDSSKFLWMELHRDATRYWKGRDIIRYCSNASETDVHQKFVSAREAAIAARRCEVASVGSSHEDSIKKWQLAIEDIRAFTLMIDPDKVRNFKRFKVWYLIKRRLLSFIFGMVSMLLIQWVRS